MKFCKSLNIQNVMFLMKLTGDIFPAKAMWGASDHSNAGPALAAEERPKLISCGDYGRPPYFTFVLGKTHSHSAVETEFLFPGLSRPVGSVVLSAGRASPSHVAHRWPFTQAEQGRAKGCVRCSRLYYLNGKGQRFALKKGTDHEQ